jgi:hypothetical protein
MAQGARRNKNGAPGPMPIVLAAAASALVRGRRAHDLTACDQLHGVESITARTTARSA